MNTLSERYIKLANSHGSTTKTIQGALEWFKKNPLKSRRISFDGNRSSVKSIPRSLRWSDEERNVKRAGKDKKFRKSFLEKTRNEIRKLTIPFKNPSLAEITAYQNNIENVEIKLKELTNRFVVLTGKPSSISSVVKLDGILVHTPPVEIARKMGCKIDLTGKDSSVSSTKKSSYLLSSPGRTFWRWGRPMKYQRCTRDNYIRSFAVIRNSQTIDVAFHIKEFSITLPNEYLWIQDQNGLKIVIANSRQDDYHPTMSDLLEKNVVSHLIRLIHHNRENRLKVESQRMADIAEMEGVYICVGDSIRAGNCKAGTKSFIERNELDVKKHYTATELSKIANGDWGRVRLAIKAAMIRNKREIDVGFSKLEEHYTNI